MRITISQRLKPFSHTPGATCMLPGSTLSLEIFPTLVRFYDLSGSAPKLVTEIALFFNGPVKDFTVQQDLEKGNVRIWGKYKEGFVRLHLFSIPGMDRCAITVKRCPEKGVPFSCLDRPVRKKETIIVGREIAFLEKGEGYLPPNTDRLSLGCHKAQDWDLICRRSDLKEVFPFWFRLGQLVKPHSSDESSGTSVLLTRCREIIQAKDKLAVTSAFLNLFHAGFGGMLTPRLEDTEHQGLGGHLLGDNPQGSPLVLLSQGAMLIRSLFVKVGEMEMEVLPLLPPEFHCGRYVNINCPGVGTLDIEWTKKTIRRMIFHSKADTTLAWKFQKKIKTYRLRDGNRDRGKVLVAGAEVPLDAGKSYYFDNFTR